jgi:trimethylamine--corrinoid protein Co-methyltransferase
MARYRNAFYEPLVADLSNYGNWTEAGSKTATERAQGIWRRILAEFQPPAATAGVADILAPFIERRTAEGGAAPVS